MKNGTKEHETSLKCIISDLNMVVSGFLDCVMKKNVSRYFSIAKKTIHMQYIEDWY